ncbi:MAG: dihydrodipicolinate synthase family protein [Kiritimatiellia bacterium]
MADILRRQFDKHQGHVIVAIGGPGGTGKSTFAERLAQQLAAPVLRLDDYKTSRAIRQRSNLFGPHPAANKMDLIATHLSCLRKGHAFDKPVYDAGAGAALGTEKYTPSQWNIVEGEVATYEQFRDLVDFAIFIDADWRTQLATRLKRDINQRSYSLDKAIATFLHSNLREFSAHGAASKQWADVHLYCHENYQLSLESISLTLYENHRDLLDVAVTALEPQGLIVPLLTPFDEHGGIHQRAFVEHLAWLTAAGVRKVIVGDATGEYFSLTSAERLQLLQLALEYWPGLVWFQVGGGPLPDAQRLAREAERLGVDGIVCLAPRCSGSSPQGLADYFKQIGATIPTRFLPANHHQSLAPDILQKLDCYGMVDYDGNRTLASAAHRYFDAAGNLDGKTNSVIGWIRAAANADPLSYLDRSGQFSGYRANGTASDVPSLKAMVRNRLPGYPTAVRPPLSSADVRRQ